MGFPAGMQLATIAFGIPLTATGKEVVTNVTVKPTARLIWAATGQPLPEFEDSFTAEAGQLGQFQVPFVDQPGFIDSLGNAVTDFAYQVTASWQFGNARPITWSKNLKPLLGQTGPIDLDLVPDGPVSIPVTAPTASVLGFNGRTGFITLQDSDLPSRLSAAELSATYAPASGSANYASKADVAAAAKNAVNIVSPNNLSIWRKALGAAMFQQTGVVFEGDSITAGGNSGNEVPNTTAQKLTALRRGYVSQFRTLLNNLLGVDAGEGWVGLGGDEGRWTFSGATPGPIAAGPVATGVRLPAGNDATALAQDFTTLDFFGFTGGNVTHPPRIEIDDVDVRPSLMSADGKNAVVGAGKWAAVGANTTVAQAGTRNLAITAVASGTVRADFGAAAGEFAVTPGQAYFVTAAGSGTSGRLFGISLYFYTSADVQVGAEIAVNGTTGTGAFVQTSGFITVPATAAKAKVTLRGNSTMNAGEVINIRDFDVIPVTSWAVSGGTSYKMAPITVGAGTHKIKIIGPNSTQADIAGLSLRKRTDAGVLVHRIAKSGSTSTDHVTNASGANATAQQFLAQNEFLNSIVPVSLRVIALGTNDFGGGTISPATYRANLVTMINKAVAAGECVLLMAGTRFSDNTGKTYPEDDFYAQAKDLAKTMDKVAYIDFIESWGDKTKATSLGFRDPAFGIHPTLAGHGDYARTLFDALTRQVVTPAA